MKKVSSAVRVILFDWDGTLLDSFAADSAAYLSMFRALGIAWSLREVSRHYSPDWHRVYRAARLPRAEWETADRLWKRAYKQQTPELLPGAAATLRKLRRRFRLGVVSSGSRWRVAKQVRDLGVGSHFEVCVCGDDAVQRKPHPATLRLALRHLCATSEETIYVGDAAEDIEMARRAGVRAIGVLGPFPTAARLRAAQPEALLKSVRDLPDYLSRNGTLP